MNKAFILTIALVQFFLCGGCVTAPQYAYSEHEDSARIVGPGVPSRRSESSTCSIIITQVDGLGVHFEASSANAPGWLYSKKPLCLAHGKHEISLDITGMETVAGNPGPRRAGVYGDIISSGSKPTIVAEFISYHIYRVTANVYGNSIEVVLWDETADLAAPFRVGCWTFDSNSEYHRG
jgi:hypothetical protein